MFDIDAWLDEYDATVVRSHNFAELSALAIKAARGLRELQRNSRLPENPWTHLDGEICTVGPRNEVTPQRRRYGSPGLLAVCNHDRTIRRTEGTAS